MVKVLQLTFSERDMLADHLTSVVALADDCAPSATDPKPRDVLHKMQIHGSPFHMEFGVSKCKLLITARPKNSSRAALRN